MFRNLASFGLVLCLAALPLSRANAQTVITQAPAPADWGQSTLSGITFAVPPDWVEVDRNDEEVIIFGGDMAKRTGPGFRLLLERKPMQLLQGSPFDDKGEVVFENGAVFHRYSATETPEAGFTIEGDFLMSTVPVIGDRFMVAVALGYNDAIADHRATFDTLFGTLGVPAPGAGVVQSALAGAFGYELPEGWKTGSYNDSEALILSRPGAQGEITLMRHAAASSASARSGWFYHRGTKVEPVLLLGQPAVSFEWRDASRHYSDDRDSHEFMRLFIFETCLANGDSASIKVAGMPDFHTSAQVMRLIDRLVFAPDGAACPAASLPEDAVLGTPVQGRPEASGFTLWIPPFAPDETWRNQVFGSVSYAIPDDWIGGPIEGGARWTSSQRQYQLTLGQSQTVPKPAARRAELRLPDGTRFFRFGIPDGTRMVSAAPIGTMGHLVIDVIGGSPDGPGFVNILGSVTLPEPAPLTDPATPQPLLRGLVTLTPPPGFDLVATDDSVTLTAKDGRGFLMLARGAAVLPPDGVIGQMPEGRLGSFAELHRREWTEYGWPGTAPDFLDRDMPDDGWYFMNILNECLPGGEPVAFVWGGISRFLGGKTLDAARNAFNFDWPDGMAACDPVPKVDDTAAAADLTDPAEDLPATAAAPLEAAPTPDTQPATTGQASGAEWFGQAPLGATASPATESLSGDWRGETLALGEAPMTGAAPAPTYSGPPQTQAAPAPPPLPVAPEAPPDEQDHFTYLDGGYSIYQNDRYGTFISYPSSYFLPEPPPANGDGRRFSSADGTAGFYVFAQFNALGQSQAEMIAMDKSDPAHGTVSYERSGPGWYVLSGTLGDDIFYRRVIEDGDGLVQVFEITYPAARKADFDAVAAYMADSFGPGSDMAAAQPSATALPAVDEAALHMPERGTAERGAIIDAARPAAAQDIGRDVIFVISQLRTDGTWAYLQGRPVNPDGSALEWSRTPFAADIRAGVMSDVYMALLLKKGGVWTLVESALGPTDVAWYDWLQPHGLPEALFSER